MLNNEAKRNIQIIKETAAQIWGSNCGFGDIEIKNSPYPEFEMPMRLYNKIDVVITYDRSIMGIALKTKKGDIWVDDLTSKVIYDGFDSIKPGNIHHNFLVLDEVIREMLIEGEI